MTDDPKVNASAPPPKSGRERRWMRVLLIGSLAVNLLIAGLVAGAFVRGGPPGAPGGRLDLSVGPLARALDEGDRREIAEALRQSRPFGREERAALRQDFADLLTHLRAPDFDADAMRSVLERQRARMVGAQDTVYDAVLERVETMTHEQRVAFADRLQREMHHVGERDRDRDRPSQ